MGTLHSTGTGGRSPEWSRPLRVRLVQTPVVPGDMDANLQSALRLAEASVKGGGVDLVVLPEAFSTGFPYDELGRLRRRFDEVVGSLQEFARERSVHVMFTQIVGAGEGLRNRCHLLARDGSIAGTYDKTHLFTRSKEHTHMVPGGGLELFRVEDVLIGPLICYELRFPELSRRLVRSGARLLVYMAEWPKRRIFQWDTMLRARAIEDQCYVVGVNVTGDHYGMAMGGSSGAYSPYGDILCHLSEEPGWSPAELDPAYLLEVRRRIPAYRELREDLKGP